jgi:hypothetical protein
MYIEYSQRNIDPGPCRLRTPAKNATDMDGPKRCSQLTVESEERQIQESKNDKIT